MAKAENERGKKDLLIQSPQLKENDIDRIDEGLKMFVEGKARIYKKTMRQATAAVTFSMLLCYATLLANMRYLATGFVLLNFFIVYRYLTSRKIQMWKLRDRIAQEYGLEDIYVSMSKRETPKR